MDFSTDGTKMLYLHQNDTTTILKRHHVSDFSIAPRPGQLQTNYLLLTVKYLEKY